MSFATIKDHIPELRCSCGHLAQNHLYCGEHFCLMRDCACNGFEVAANYQNAVILADYAELQSGQQDLQACEL